MQRLIPILFAVLVLVLVLATASPVIAQPAEVNKQHAVRFTRTLGQIAGREGVSIWMHRAKTATGWEVRLFDKSRNKTVGTATLPEWFGADYYGYDVIVRGFGNVVVIIFEAAPAPGVDAPPAAERAQIAWAYGVKRGAKKAVWQQIASTRNSPIDGGDRLVIRREDKRDELIRLRSSENTRFCGTDLAAYQTFIPEQMAFRSRLDVRTLVDGATPLTAVLPDAPFEESPYRRFSLWYSATTDRYNADDSRTVVRPLELGDWNVETPWIEGAPGMGDGEFATARVNDALKTRAIRIFPGNGASEDDYEAFASPKRVLVSLSEGSRFVIDIPETPYRLTRDRGGVIVNLPRPVRTNCMTVVLLDARAGRADSNPEDAGKRSSVAISEISPISELHGLPPDVAALVVVEKLLKEEERAKARRLVQLTAPLASELVKVLENVLREGTEEDRIRVIPLLRSLPSDSSVPILVQMFEQAKPGDKAYTLVKPAISAHGDKAAEELVAVLEQRPPDDERKYTDLTRMIGRLGRPDTVSVLIARFGDGSERVRAERVRAVARGGASLLDALFAEAAGNIDTARGQDALTAVNAIGRKLHYRGQGQHEGSRALIKILRESERRRTKLLALKGLGFFATEGAVDALASHVGGSADPLVRKQAVESLARYPDREARIMLEAALLDGSPDVRIAAVDGLRSRRDRRQSLAAIQSYSEREEWHPGLEVAYTVMAEIGDPQQLAAMETEIARAPNSPRASIIAESMERADRPLRAELAASLLRSPETSVDMRRDLIDLLGLDDTALGEQALLEAVRNDDFFAELNDRQNRRLRNRALLSLGRRDSGAGRAELLRIVREGTSNDDKSMALRALAFSRNEKVVIALRELRESAPAELKDEFDSTIETVDRRSDIEDARQEIEELEKAAAQEIEKAKARSAPDKNSPRKRGEGD